MEDENPPMSENAEWRHKKAAIDVFRCRSCSRKVTGGRRNRSGRQQPMIFRETYLTGRSTPTRPEPVPRPRSRVVSLWKDARRNARRRRRSELSSENQSPLRFCQRSSSGSGIGRCAGGRITALSPRNGATRQASHPCCGCRTPQSRPGHRLVEQRVEGLGEVLPLVIGRDPDGDSHVPSPRDRHRSFCRSAQFGKRHIRAAGDRGRGKNADPEGVAHDALSVPEVADDPRWNALIRRLGA